MEKLIEEIRKLPQSEQKKYFCQWDEFIAIVRSSGLSRGVNSLLCCSPLPMLIRHIELATGKKRNSLTKQENDYKTTLNILSLWRELRLSFRS
jgi:hypothetical protein